MLLGRPLADSLVTRMVAENEKLKQEQAALVKAMQDHALRLSEVQRRQEELAEKARDVSRVAMAELETSDEEDRAAGKEPEPLPEEQPAEASTSAASAPADWTVLDATSFPVSWLGSPSPLVDPDSSGGIPPASQGNSNS